MIVSSVPGKVMLAGEYSVLDGQPALAFTVDRRIHCTAEFTPPGSGSTVASTLWPQPVTFSADDEGHEQPLLDTVGWALKHWDCPDIKLDIRSEIHVADGLGSSSAVRLASLGAIARLVGRPESPWDLARICWQQQRKQQGFASGYDFATQVQGGLVAFTPDYQRWPGDLESLSWGELKSKIHIFRGGAGAPTKTVAGSTRAWLEEQGRWPELLGRSQELVMRLRSFAKGKSAFTDLIEAIRQHRDLFSDSPHFPRYLGQAFTELRGYDQAWTYKTTGAGGEDSILLIGAEEDLSDAIHCLKIFGWHPLDTKLGSEGMVLRDSE